jgi:hypothetical protein
MKTTFKTQAAQTAQLIRKDLKEFFPKIKFTVKSDSYAGGDAVRISFIDSPYLTSEVESKLKKYQYGRFNGMEDIYENSNSIDGLPQVKFIQVQRNKSEEAKALILIEITSKFAGYENLTIESYAPQHNQWMSSLVHQEFSSRRF